MSTRKKRTRLLVAGSVTTAVALAAAGYGIASAGEDPPALAFRAATTNVNGIKFTNPEGRSWTRLDLGLNLIAGKQPFEIHAKRSDYAHPIVASQVVTGRNGKKQSVALPDGLFTTFAGFEDFTTVTIKDTAGKTVAEYKTDWCPNTSSSDRTRPDAPATTPYPTECAGDNPFTLGSVWGVQAGYNAPIESYPRESGPDPELGFNLPTGDFKVTVKITDKYKKWLNLADKDATADLNLKIAERKVEDDPKGAAVAKAVIRAAVVGDELAEGAAGVKGEHGEHAGQGDNSIQVSAKFAKFRPPAKAPKPLARTPRSGPRPDLRALPAWGISLEEKDGKAYVNFGATVWNAGTSPLLVDGFRRTGTELMDAYQYFYDASGKEVGSVEAGTMEWDAREGHRHWHFTDFAQYSLLGADKKKIEKSGKEAFCLANTDAVDYTVQNANWRPDNNDLSSSCGANTAVAVREVLDVGSGDTYTQDRPGQSFDVTDVPNGTYYIETLANPAKKLSELKTDNNSSLRQIVLGGTPGNRTLEVPPVNGIVG